MIKMAISKDGCFDPHELASAIAEQQRERKNKALELRIAEKADCIAKVLGDEFQINNYSIPQFLPSEYKVYQKGSTYQGNMLRIERGTIPKEIDEKERELKFTRISILKREKGFFSWLARNYEEVYLQMAYEGEDTDLGVFEKEDLWLGCFNALYDFACKKKDFEEAKDNVRKLEITKH